MIPLMIAVLMSGVIAYDMYSRSKGIRQRLRFIEQRLPDLKYNGSFANYRLKGMFGGVPVTVSVTPGGNRSRPKIMVTCHKATPFKVVILRNEPQSDFFTRLAHMPVLCSIVTTNDKDFDARFSVYSHNSTDISGYFYNTERKNAVARVFDLGYTLLEFKGRSFSAQKFGYDIENDLRQDTVINILEKVCVLSRGF